MRFRFPLSWVRSVAALLVLGSPALAQRCVAPTVPAATLSGPTPPVDVCFPPSRSGSPFLIEYFDDFSWRNFIAMVWPAAAGQRGKPDVIKSVGSPGPRVFETFKSPWEVFHADGSPPSSQNFDDYEAATYNSCNATAQFGGELVLTSVSKFDDIAQAGFGVQVSPLPDQTGHYVRYLTHYSRPEFTMVYNKRWYLKSQLPAGGTGQPAQAFPSGSISVKSAWIDMTPYTTAQRSRFYTTQAAIRDPSAPSAPCRHVTVGLVGLHIVAKTPSRPQWIWSTFDHVDNVPPPSSGRTFNDGLATTMPPSSPISFPPPPPEPAPHFNIDRLKPIFSSGIVSTVATNAAYQSLLAGTVWANYQLVMTQYPVRNGMDAKPVPVNQDGTPPNTFPGPSNPNSGFANPVMETFLQQNVSTGCMNCHNFARQATDFVYSITTHAYAPPPADSSRPLPVRFELVALRNLLQSIR